MIAAGARLAALLLLLLSPLVLAGAAAPSDAAAHMLTRRKISPNLMALLLSASHVAELAVAPERRANLFATQGNIFDVPDEERRLWRSKRASKGLCRRLTLQLCAGWLLRARCAAARRALGRRGRLQRRRACLLVTRARRMLLVYA
jgi:hypothetical protein